MRSVTTVGGVVAILCGAFALAACGSNGPLAGVDAPAQQAFDARIAIDALTASDATIDGTPHIDASPDANPNRTMAADWTPEFSHILEYFQLDGTPGMSVANNTDIVATVGNDGVSESRALPSESLQYITGAVGSGLQFDYSHSVSALTNGTVSGSFSVQVWIRFDDLQVL